MTDLINRLRTGTHEQAVGLLRECYKAIFPPRNTLPQGSSERDAAYWRDENFNALLGIGTPEACVGAAMMLTEGKCILLAINPVTNRHYCVLHDQPLGTVGEWGEGQNGNTAALALTAAIMEARNDAD